MTTPKKKARQRRLKKAGNIKRNNQAPRFLLLYLSPKGWQKSPITFNTRAEYKRYAEEMERLRQADDQDIYKGRVYDRTTQLTVLTIPGHTATKKPEENDHEERIQAATETGGSSGEQQAGA